MTITLPLTGGCLCGAVRYEVTAQRLLVTACHCTTCQTRSGSAFAMTMIVPRGALGVTQGQPITREIPSASGRVSAHYYCDACLVRLYSEPAMPTISYVRPGTLDDRKWITPAAQIWTRSAQPWAIAEGVPCFEEGFTDAGALIAAWQAAHQVGG